jgi:dihydrofolate synthase/folylpolyglutamate synthase
MNAYDEFERLCASNQATYQHLNDYLTSLIDFERLIGGKNFPNEEREFQLQEFRQLLGRLDSPHQACPVVHVAGTKGKGSVCALVASILRAHGLRIGQYSSPHLERYTERILIDGLEIEPAHLGRLLVKVRQAQLPGKTSELRPEGWRTLFEQLTAAAFLAFAEAGVDVAVVETGLGGRLDATNVHQSPSGHPLISAITSIGLDHMAILGDTPLKIAREKLAIIQPWSVSVLGEQPAEWADQVEQAMEERLETLGKHQGSSLSLPLKAGECFLPTHVQAERWLERIRFRVQAPEWPESEFEGRLALPGLHQVTNCQTALAIILQLQRRLSQLPHHPLRHWRISLRSVQEGLETVRWPARMEVLDPLRPVVIDGSHCPLSIAAAMSTYCRHTQGHPRTPLPTTLVFGVMQDKDLGGLVEAMVSAGAKFRNGKRDFEGMVINRLIATQAAWPRAMSAGQLANDLRKIPGLDCPVEVEPDPKSAFMMALKDPGQSVLGLGSLYLPSDFRRAWLDLSNC